MKTLVFLLAAVFPFCLAREVLDVNSLDIEKLKFQLDEEWVNNFIAKYEEGDAGEITAVVNEYADMVFKLIEDFAIENHLDPLNLTDVEEEFLTASINLTNGRLNGIATIKRADDCTISYSPLGNTVEVYLPIVFTDLNFTYDYHVIILLIGPKGSIVGDIKEFTINIKIKFDFNLFLAIVEEVDVTNKGHISLTFHGNAITDIVVNILSEFVAVILQPVISFVIEGVVSDVVKLVVSIINDVIDGIFHPGSSTISTTTVESFF